MITVNNVTMGFTNRTLFKDVSFSIFPNEKIGLTGPNGAGKSTLFSLIRSKQEPVAGTIQIQKNINIGYLPQEAEFSSTKTVIEELTEGDERISKLMKEKRELEDSDKAGSNRYGDVLEKLEQLGIYDIEHKAEKVLSGLGFKEEDFQKPISTLSGGWQMRTLLAKLLTYSYDLLLLDEPTNYLDLPATLWLKDYLGNYDGAFVMISHDRVFLNEVTNYSVILDNGQMIKVKGNYLEFEQQREILTKGLEKRQKVVEKKRQQLERFTQRFHAQPNRASAVRNKRKMIEKLDKIELPQSHKSMGDFQFPVIQPSGYVVCHAQGLSKSYGEKKIYEGLDFEVVRNQKICLVGPNGAGKSTLLKMLAEVVEPDQGKIKYGHNVDKGYFSQTRLDVLNPNRTAFEEVGASVKDGSMPALQIRNLLGLFNYRGDDVFKSVKILSGGEKSRLILAKLLINPPNFLLLDEPTTHLDLDGVKALTRAFQKYAGTIVFISHDLYFIQQVADHIVEIDNGEAKMYPGDLDYYLGKKNQKLIGSGKETKAQIKEIKDKKEEKIKKKKDYKAQKENDTLNQIKNKHKEAKKRLNEIKNEIKRSEKELKDLELESYAKSRKMNELYDNRDEETIKEYGARLKEIQKRQREVETRIKQLNDERKGISK